jgi:hypothetical protein
MNPVIKAFSGGALSVVLLGTLLCGFVVGFQIIAGYWLYALGWLIAGHGYALGPLRINLLVLYVLSFSFLFWGLLKAIFKKMGKPLKFPWSQVVLLMIFVVVLILWFVLGLLMMAAGDGISGAAEALQPLTDLYNSLAMIIEPFLLIPSALIIWYSIAKLYWKHGRD